MTNFILDKMIRCYEADECVCYQNLSCKECRYYVPEAVKIKVLKSIKNQLETNEEVTHNEV